MAWWYHLPSRPSYTYHRSKIAQQPSVCEAIVIPVILKFPSVLGYHSISNRVRRLTSTPVGTEHLKENSPLVVRREDGTGSA